MSFEIVGRVGDSESGLAVDNVEVRATSRTARGSRVVARTTTRDGGGFVLVYGGGREPVPVVPALPTVETIWLSVWRGEELLPGKETKEFEWDGSREVLLVVDAGLEPAPEPAPEADPAPTPAPDPVPPAATAEPPALTITELGEALAATAASIQQELAHYPTANGAFVLDDLDIEIPAGFGVDRLGQLRVNVGGNAGAEPAGRLRLRVKPLLEPPEPRSVTAPQPLEALAALGAETIAKLEAERVYSVGDLLRISRNAAGRKALDELGVPDLDGLRGRAEVVALPTVPSRVAESLVQVGVTDPKAFVAADPGVLAQRLSERLGERLEATDVSAWQTRTRPLVVVPRVEVEPAG